MKTREVIMFEIVLVANLSTKMFVISMIFNTLMVNHTKKTSKIGCWKINNLKKDRLLKIIF